MLVQSPGTHPNSPLSSTVELFKAGNNVMLDVQNPTCSINYCYKLFANYSKDSTRGLSGDDESPALKSSIFRAERELEGVPGR